MSAIKPRERDALFQALRAGVVPKLGLHHLQVGRVAEITELVGDMERLARGGTAMRFIVGDYGSGKTFFMNLIRLIALEKGMVCMFADLAPDRRLQSTGGQARALYAELARNISTRTRPDGGALPAIVERFVSLSRQDAEQQGVATDYIIRQKLAGFEEMTGGYDFAQVIRRYCEGHETGDDTLKAAALRWLRGEFPTKTDARKALNVRTIVEDSSFYDQLKLMSAFVTASGYKGLLVGLDEMVNLLRLASAQSRAGNYEQILRILNDVLQGSAENLGFLMGGTPEFLMNPRRGLYSYEALQTRLAENTFARNGLVDLSGPVIRLNSLTQEELMILLQNIRRVLLADAALLPDAALEAFMVYCSSKIGDAYFRTPRNTITAFVNMIAVLQQNPGTVWQDLLDGVELRTDSGDDLDLVDDLPAIDAAGPDDDLTSFKL